MPIKRGSDSKGPYSRWGKHGKKYHYKAHSKIGRMNAKKKAIKQRVAATYNGYKGEGLNLSNDLRDYYRASEGSGCGCATCGGRKHCKKCKKRGGADLFRNAVETLGPGHGLNITQEHIDLILDKTRGRKNLDNEDVLFEILNSFYGVNVSSAILESAITKREQEEYINEHSHNKSNLPSLFDYVADEVQSRHLKSNIEGEIGRQGAGMKAHYFGPGILPVHHMRVYTGGMSVWDAAKCAANLGLKILPFLALL